MAGPLDRLRAELTDPWGLVAAGFVGGLAVVGLSVPLAAGVGIGAAVYGVKVLAGTAMGTSAPKKARPALPQPGTRSRFWIERAEIAVRSLWRMVPTDPTTPTDVAARHTASEAEAVLDSMRRLGGQAVAITTALSHADAPHLEREAFRLREMAETNPDDQVAVQSARAVAERLAVRDRLRRAEAEVEGRLQSSALGLEGLVAKVAEVRAAAAAVGQIDPSVDDLDALHQEVEGLRLGLVDVERVAERALGRER